MAAGDDFTRDDHPSYGTISWSRVTGGSSEKTHLFQSDLDHHDTIVVRVAHASLDRGLGNDWVHSRDTIVEVEMSPSQFTQFLTAPNSGDRVPCTIRVTEKDGQIERKFKDTRYAKYKAEMEDDLVELREKIDGIMSFAESLEAGKTVKKGEYKALVGQLAMLKQHVYSNIPFMKEQAHRHMSKVVEEGKVAIEAYIDGRLRDAGLEHLQSSAPELHLEHDDTGLLEHDDD